MVVLFGGGFGVVLLLLFVLYVGFVVVFGVLMLLCVGLVVFIWCWLYELFVELVVVFVVMCCIV